MSRLMVAPISPVSYTHLMLLGDAKEILARPHYALISSSLAQRIGEGADVIGQQITLDRCV